VVSPEEVRKNKKKKRTGERSDRGTENGTEREGGKIRDRV
jgi:hypothetical protein